LEPLASLILQRLGVVADGREIWHPQRGAYALDDANESVLLNPDLGPIELTCPQILAIDVRVLADDAARAPPKGMSVDFASAVFDCVTVNEPAVASVPNDSAETLIFLEQICEQRTSNKLIEQLPQSENEVLLRVLGDDGVGLFNHSKRCGVRSVADEHL